MNFFNQTALSGKDNQRLYSYEPTNNEATAAWREDCETTPMSRVEIPSDENVDEAKDWVDNGSRL